MGKRNRKRAASAPGKTTTTAAARDGAATAASSTRLILFRVIGAALLLVALGNALALSVEHLGGLKLPGCGVESPCAKAAASAFGKLPLGTGRNGEPVYWPVSFLGSAYFFALLASWLTLRGCTPTWLKFVIRLGALGSIFWIGAMITGGYLCPYCLAVHAGNLLFWLVAEQSRGLPRRASGATPAIAGVLAFAVATGGLAFAEFDQRAAVEREAREQAEQSTADIVRNAQQGESHLDLEPNQSEPIEADANTPADPNAGGTPNGDAEDASLISSPFTGRYHVGPREAPIRIVAFTSYQCADCYLFEKELEPLLARRSDISFSIKHFPLSSKCNPLVNIDPQPNACVAAGVAEAAGILRGDEGFWQMHKWLFARRGGFNEQQLTAALVQFGYTPREFFQVVTSPEIGARIKADCLEGNALGLHFTPMIFINGVEFKGWRARGALTQAILTLAEQNLPAQGPEVDHPPLAAEKYIEDWAQSPRQLDPKTTYRHTRGAPDAKIRIIMFSDYQSPPTAEAISDLDALIKDRDDVSFTWRNYPANSQCNPHVSKVFTPQSCWAAKAAEAAGRLGGDDAFWKLHDWLVANQDSFTEAALRGAAEQIGLDPDKLLAEMNSPEVAAIIQEDVEAGHKLGVQRLPTFFINERFVPRWKRPGADVLARILEIAEQQGE